MSPDPTPPAVFDHDRSRDWPSLALRPDQLATLELLAGGALSPVEGFMGAAAVRSVVQDGHLPDGTPWSTPITLSVPAAVADGLAGKTVALRDAEGVLLAAMRDTVVEGVGEGGMALLHGPLEVIELPVHYDHPDLRRTARGIAELGLPGLVVLAAGRPLDRRDIDELAQVLDHVAGEVGEAPTVVVQSLVGAAAADDYDVQTLIRAHRLLVSRLAGDERTSATGALHAIVPLAAPSDDASHALVRHVAANSGARATLVVDHDRAPGEFPADITELLARRTMVGDQRGVTLFFTGLSGSGKSTVASAVMALLHGQTDRRVTLLDGDLVRQHLSSELGFSREHRDLNITGIGFVAAEVTRHGGIAICAPIAPYDATRRTVRDMVSRGGEFILIHVATPLDVCERRDRKGLYAKARAGLIGSFTGISDPYEAPTDAEARIDTSELSVAQAAQQVVDLLAARGLVAVDAPGAA